MMTRVVGGRAYCAAAGAMAGILKTWIGHRWGHYIISCATLFWPGAPANLPTTGGGDATATPTCAKPPHRAAHFFYTATTTVWHSRAAALPTGGGGGGDGGGISTTGGRAPHYAGVCRRCMYRLPALRRTPCHYHTVIAACLLRHIPCIRLRYSLLPPSVLPAPTCTFCCPAYHYLSYYV